LGAETLENGTKENDAKGWYIILADQGNALECSNCSYSGTVSATSTDDRDNHDGEKILSEIGLYAGVLYFTSYQPSISDPCHPQGNGFAYSLNYDDATAAYNINSGDTEYDVTDRYWKVNTIYGIPSKFAIITRMGQAGAMAMMGGRVIPPRPPKCSGPNCECTGPDCFKIKGPRPGLELYYWREGNSEN
jgi:type IV pilus assembly protein PilY1